MVNGNVKDGVVISSRVGRVIRNIGEYASRIVLCRDLADLGRVVQKCRVAQSGSGKGSDADEIKDATHTLQQIRLSHLKELANNIRRDV